MMPPRYFKDRFYLLLVAILFLGFFSISWRAELLVEIEPTPRVQQGSWWRFSLHQESTKALGGDLAYTKSPPRLLVEI